MLYPTLDDARKLATGFSLLPVASELYCDIRTPVQVLKSIHATGSNCYLLESAHAGENWGRYTFLGYKPSQTIHCKGNTVFVTEAGRTDTMVGDPIEILRSIITQGKSPHLPSLPHFTGGYIGYFSYEHICKAEPSLILTNNDTIGFHDFKLMRFDKVIAFDSLKQKIFLITNIQTSNLEQNYIDAVGALKDMERLIYAQADGLDMQEADALKNLKFYPSFTKNEFCSIVERAKHYIYEGDIFQCVPSIRFSAKFKGDLVRAYRVLRTTNPSAYMFYVKFDDMELSGASPETLVSLHNNVVTTYPLAGTCARTDDDNETQSLIDDLLKDEKELAEHDMLVDLGRNDLGKVCRFGSVSIPEYRKIKKLSHVCHIASKVTGVIADGKDAIDVITACMPAGTLSGAPKKRACELIDEFEGSRRGVYGGAVGYIDFTGDMDFCIGIRMAILKNGIVHVQSGAGIVADSVPEKEYEECMRKAHAMMEALKL
ncbi:MAG: chorismate-binding protein [Christensenellaceae bacterium]|jgi:anthranilate synthase component 1|nr:chorismate-binding protein [Christensenellaceae bacterium]